MRGQIRNMQKWFEPGSNRRPPVPTECKTGMITTTPSNRHPCYLIIILLSQYLSQHFMFKPGALGDCPSRWTLQQNTSLVFHQPVSKSFLSLWDSSGQARHVHATVSSLLDYNDYTVAYFNRDACLHDGSPRSPKLFRSISLYS